MYNYFSKQAFDICSDLFHNKKFIPSNASPNQVLAAYNVLMSEHIFHDSPIANDVIEFSLKLILIHSPRSLLCIIGLHVSLPKERLLKICEFNSETDKLYSNLITCCIYSMGINQHYPIDDVKDLARRSVNLLSKIKIPSLTNELRELKVEALEFLSYPEYKTELLKLIKFTEEGYKTNQIINLMNKAYEYKDYKLVEKLGNKSIHLINKNIVGYFPPSLIYEVIILVVKVEIKRKYTKNIKTHLNSILSLPNDFHLARTAIDLDLVKFLSETNDFKNLCFDYIEKMHSFLEEPQEFKDNLKEATSIYQKNLLNKNKLKLKKWWKFWPK
ncbi:MAG: hypothetical protein COB02_09590 [Candidatus Cloacimonadota bacterium]|nr:MAG: hypothetical protein COB02_09590 [Candidatus Cloacimonadota bacterium]